MGIVVVFLNGGVCLASFPFVAFKFSFCIYSAQEIWVYMWETQDPSHNKRLPFFSETAHAVCVQVEDVRLLKILGNSPALTVETMSEIRVIYFFDSTFIEHLLCSIHRALHYACQLQKKQICLRPGPCFQGTYNLTGEIKGLCKQPYLLQRKDYSGSKQGH